MLSLIAPWFLLAPPADTGSPPADFKLVVELRGVKSEATTTATLVFRGGVAYQFLSALREEVQVIDPVGPTITLIDLKHRVQSQVSTLDLDWSVGRLHQSVEGAIRRREHSGERSERVAAAMSRDLIDPDFRVGYDDASHRLRLTNPTVEVEARGEPEPDARRHAAVGRCLLALAKMGALRDPTGLPPFPLIETLRALGERSLRPGEISILYRLSGPPVRLRWAYRLTPGLTPNEREAIARVDALRASARFVRYPVYQPGERETQQGGRAGEEPPARKD